MTQKLVINLDVDDIEVELRDEIIKDAFINADVTAGTNAIYVYANDLMDPVVITKYETLIDEMIRELERDEEDGEYNGAMDTIQAFIAAADTLKATVAKRKKQYASDWDNPFHYHINY